MRNAIRTDLGATSTDLTDNELERAVQRAVSDLSLRLPKSSILDITVSLTVTNEPVVNATVAGTWVTLRNKRVRPASEVLTNAAGTVTYTRDVDYRMDYANGRVASIPGAAITVGQSLLIDYLLLGTAFDLGPLNGSMYRVRRVGYQAGAVPETTLDFRVENTMLELGAGIDTQARVVEGQHIWVYYDGPQDPPTGLTIGSYPGNLNELVIKGAGMYCLMSLASKQYLRSAADLETARSRILAAVTLHTEQGVIRVAITATHLIAKGALDRVVDQVTKADAALVDLDSSLVTLLSILAAATDRGPGSVLNHAELELLQVDSGLVEAAEELNKVENWQGATTMSDLATAESNIATASADIADAKAAFDQAATVLATVSGQISGVVASDLASANSAVSGALASITTAQTIAQTADDNLPNVAAALTTAELASAVGAIGAAVVDVDTAKVTGPITAALDKVTVQLSDTTGAGKALADSAAEFTAAGNALGLTSTGLADADTALDKVAAEATAADTAAGAAGVKNDAGDQYTVTGQGYLTQSQADATSATVVANSGVTTILAAVDAYLGLSATALNKITNGNAHLATTLVNALTDWTNLGFGYTELVASYLTDGDDFINTVNTGKDVPENFGRYSELSTQQVRSFIEHERDMLENARIDLGVTQSWIAEAAERTKNASVKLESLGGQATVGRVLVEAANSRVAAAQQAVGLLQGKVAQAGASVQIALARIRTGELDVAEGQARSQLAIAHVEEAKVRTQLVAEHVSVANSRVEMARTFVAEASARVEMQRSLAALAGVKVQAGDTYRAVGAVRVEIARTWVAESTARSEIGRNLAEVARAHADVARSQVAVAEQRVNGAATLVRDGEALVAEGQGLVARASARIAASRGSVEVALARIQAAGTYVQTASQRIAIVQAHINAALAWIEEAKHLALAAQGFLALCRCHIEEAQVRVQIGQLSVNEGHERIEEIGQYNQTLGQLNGEINSLLGEAQGYHNSVDRAVALAKELQSSADFRRAEYQAVLQTGTLLQPDTGYALATQLTR
jgi:hypothetical protein